MEKTLKGRIKLLSYTSSEWNSKNPILFKGEVGIESDTSKFKFGDGESDWKTLSYAGVDAYTAGTGISISGENEIGVKVVAANGLSVDASGIKMAVATTGMAGALSAADKTKLDSVSSGAQANVIESISINGEKISPVEKDVPIPIASATRLGVIKADNTSISISGDGTASVKSVNTSLLSQNEDDVLIIDCSI